MLVFDNNNEAVVLDNILSPTLTEHFWVLDLDIMDFTLSPLLVLEEIPSPAIQVVIMGFAFNLPTGWNMLVVDEETSTVDMVEVRKLPGKEFKALVYGPECTRPEFATVTANDYIPMERAVGPSLNKHQLLCHPISPVTWVCVSPSDAYNKYLKNRLVGDII